MVKMGGLKWSKLVVINGQNWWSKMVKIGGHKWSKLMV